MRHGDPHDFAAEPLMYQKKIGYELGVSQPKVWSTLHKFYFQHGINANNSVKKENPF